MTTADPYITFLAHTHHLSPDTDTIDLTVEAIGAEAKHLAVRTKVAIDWDEANLGPDREPKAGAAFYRIDAYIRSLLERHHLTARPGEDDTTLTHRAMAAEYRQISRRAGAMAQAANKAAATIDQHPDAQPRP